MLRKVLFSILLMGLFCVNGFAAETKELNFVCLTNSAHPNTKAAIDPWISEVAKLTDNKLQIFRYEVNTLCPARETYDATVQGLIDIGSNTVADNPGLFPLHSVLELPLLSWGSRVTTRTANDLYAKYPEWRDEMKDIHLLWYWASPSFLIHTSKKPVRTLEDLKGLRLLVWNSSTQEIVSRLGGIPIMVPPTDTYLSLQRGMADGVVSPTAALRAWKLDEVTKYHTLADITANVFWLGVNKKSWDGLSDEFKKVLTDTAATMSEKCSEATDILGAQADLDYVAKNGQELISLSNEELARWQTMLQPLYDQWLSDMAKRGIKVAPQVFEDARTLAEAHHQELLKAEKR